MWKPNTWGVTAVVATLAVVAARNLTVAQQAKETALQGSFKEGNGVACRSMVDADPLESPRMEVGEDERYFSLLTDHINE
jgi:hypothetical protein